MRDFKCVACRIRTRRAEAGIDVVGDPCPGCGCPLEVVGGLAEVVGFRSVIAAVRPVDSTTSLGDFTARRNAIYAQRVRDTLDTEPWMDDGGYAISAVALPTAHPDEKGTT
jgi:hypothetical protein